MQYPEFYKQLTVSRKTGLKASDPISFEKIGPYHIDSLLSSSKKSHVFLAHDASHKPFVLKILSKEFSKDKTYVDQFLQEAKILKMSDHPNIVKNLDQGIADTRPYIVMPFIQGISLRQFMVHYSITLHDSFEILLQLFYALSHIHSLGIVHLDLKPENILITQNAKIMVIDFGISQFYHQKNGKAFFGTTDYMSPEMKIQKKPIDHRSDIYSAFVIAYELFTKKLCFGNIDLCKAPSFLKPFLEKGLAVDIQRRFEDIVTCIGALNALIKAHPVGKNFSMNPQIDAVTHTLLDPLIENPTLEIALAHDLEIENIYYSSHTLFDQSTLFLFYNFHGSSLEALCQSTMLKTSTKILLEKEGQNFSVASFLEALNTIAFEEKGFTPIDFQAIHIDLYNNTINSFGTGFCTLFNYCDRKKSVNIVKSTANLLGAHDRLEARATSIPFYEGDHLSVHNFIHHFPKAREAITEKTTHLLQKDHLSASKNFVKTSFSSLKKVCHNHQNTSSFLLFQVTHLN